MACSQAVVVVGAFQRVWSLNNMKHKYKFLLLKGHESRSCNFDLWHLRWFNESKREKTRKTRDAKWFRVMRTDHRGVCSVDSSVIKYISGGVLLICACKCYNIHTAKFITAYQEFC